ncbi:MAG: hypothetical protein HYW23_00295 [Candidatus Aenigmarchaeota archaeon]|nr:hypothetical protein [Candidatus Aenigmarchaeota archaeon]
MVKKLAPEAMGRLYNRVYVCKVCSSKIRADPTKVRHGKVKCRSCRSTMLRPKRKPLV